MEPCFDLPRQRWFRVIGAVVRAEVGRRMVELDGDVGGYDVRVQGTILVGLFVGLGKHETDLHSYFSDDYYTHLIILLCMLLISMLVQQQSRQDMKTFINLLNCNISFLFFFFGRILFTPTSYFMLWFGYTMGFNNCSWINVYLLWCLR